MSQCQCFAESTGERCSRDAKPGSKFCWQHEKKCVSTDATSASTSASTSTPVSASVSKALPSTVSRIRQPERPAEIEERYNEILAERDRQLLNSSLYQEYKNFNEILADYKLNLSFLEYRKLVNRAIRDFEEQYVHEDRDFGDLNDNERQQFLFDVLISQHLSS